MAPLDLFREARKSLLPVGRQGQSLIAVSELDMAEALQRCHRIDDLDLEWIEEPIATDNLDGYSRCE